MKRRLIALSLTAVLFALLVSEASAVTISGFTTINDPSAPTTSQGTVLNAVSGNNVVGHYFDASGHLNGFEYNTATNTWTNLQDPLAGPVSQGGGTIPYGISGNNIVGDFNDTSNNENGFLYNGTTWTLLDDPSAYRPEGTIATGISGNNIAGYYYTSDAVAHGFLYNMTTQAWTALNAPFPSSRTTTMVFGIGGNYVVGEYYNGGFLYNMSTNVWTILEDPFGNSPGLQGISGNNVVGIDSVLVGSVYVEEGFLYNIPTNTWCLSENPRCPQRNDSELKMQEADVICDFLLPPYQQSSRPVKPGEGALNFPTARLVATAFRLCRFCAFEWEMGDVVAAESRLFAGLADIAFVEAEMLGLVSRGFRAMDRDVVERGGQKFLVMHIGAVHRHTDRHAPTVDQHRTLDAEFATIGRVFPGFFPHPAAICSSPRPGSATSSRFPSGRRILPTRDATAPQTRRASPIPESRRGLRCQSRTAWASPSTDSRFAEHTKSHSPLSADLTGDVRLWGSVCKLVKADQCIPRGHREFGETVRQKPWPLAHLHAK